MTGRLVFTLFDVRGRPIAFAGRRLPPDESGAKYVNSPESPLWHKGSTLYGLRPCAEMFGRERGIPVQVATDHALDDALFGNLVRVHVERLDRPDA